LGATGGTGRLIVTTNLSFGEWSAVFRDATPTRLTPYQIHASQTGGLFLTTKTGPILESASSCAGCWGKEAAGFPP
jgi:hypothetical protein